MARKLLTLIVALMIVITGTVAYAAGNRPAGIIISMYAGAWVEHENGVKEPLTLKAPVYVGDLISTDKTGKVQVLFNDDTTLAVAPSSVVNIDEFVFNDTYKPFFSAKLVSGASRVISGKIVEQNPIGFKLSAPHGTAGIRGTIVSARTGANEDVFFLDSIDHSHTVSISNNKNQDNNIMSSREGSSFIVGDGPDAPIKNIPITQSDRVFLDNAFSNKPVANNVATGTKEDSSGEETITEKQDGLVSGDIRESDNKKADTEEEAKSPINEKNDVVKDYDDKNNVVIEQPKAVNASYTGELKINNSTAVPYFKGQFGFKVNVTNGKLSEGYMQGEGKGRGVFNATGGTGTIDGKGGFTSFGYLLSGTGYFSSMNFGRMNGAISDSGVIVSDWLIRGVSGSFTGTGTGQGVPLGSDIFKPYEDKVVSFAGTFNTTRGDASADRGFGFRIALVSGSISGAYLYYVENGAAIKAEGGQGAASAVSVNNFQHFGIEWSPSKVQGYGELVGVNGKRLHLQGDLGNNDTTVSDITGGIDGSFEIINGSGSIVDSLPGISSSKTASYVASWEASPDGTLSDGEAYYKYGFKVNFMSGQVSEVYAYGGNYHEGVAGVGGSDKTPFFVKGGSGQFVARNLNIQFRNMQFGENYTGQNFTLTGSLNNSNSSFNGGLAYNGSPVLGSPASLQAGLIGGSGSLKWEPLPYMIGYFDGAGVSNNNNYETGFKLNLVTGKISSAYLRVSGALGGLSVDDGNGGIDSDGDYQVDWATGFEARTGVYATASEAVLTGEFSSDYTIAEDGDIVIKAPGRELGVLNDITLKYSAVSGTGRANYTTTLAPSLSTASFAHNGGTIGFAVDFLTGTIESGGFNILRTVGGETKVIYADGAKGTLSGNTLDVSWASGEIRDENRSTDTYNSAKLQGDISMASRFILTDVSGVDITVDDGVRFATGPDYSSEKNGTVAGWVSGPNISGNYSFSANLHSGVINNASINLSSTAAGGLAASNGSGYIANGKFDIGGYGVNSSSGSLAGYGDVHMNGNNSGSNFSDIQWQIKNGGSSISGTGSNGKIQ